ncbi:membrane hypothetical protein [Limnobacter sp. 130]|uniref:hypothetical protein n=1 Tax=Limnobacter sp. 130 TaxID=2653147 RepID=UPI0012F0928A|nr:hypothetical protein [Limnobacter sp. 130]VWX32820.1 membrane hypothetical protein [Limnobacter sp. 130]
MPLKLNQFQRHILLASSIVQLVFGIFFITEEHYLAASLLTLSLTISMIIWLGDFNPNQIGIRNKRLVKRTVIVFTVGLLCLGVIGYVNQLVQKPTAHPDSDGELSEADKAVLRSIDQYKVDTGDGNSSRVNELIEANKHNQDQKYPQHIIDVEELERQERQRQSGIRP